MSRKTSTCWSEGEVCRKRVVRWEAGVFDEVEFRMFRGTIKPWEELFREAAQFASTLRPEELIGISHSEDGNDGVVAVWYWVHRDDQQDPERHP